jgi:hypothetical protein
MGFTYGLFIDAFKLASWAALPPAWLLLLTLLITAHMADISHILCGFKFQWPFLFSSLVLLLCEDWPHWPLLALLLELLDYCYQITHGICISGVQNLHIAS